MKPTTLFCPIALCSVSLAFAAAASELSPAGHMYPDCPVADAPYFDGAGVVQTAVQELLLQSHAEEPDAQLLTGGVVKLVPDVAPAWRGSFRLHARGGFVVECAFDGRKVTSCAITSTRGETLRYRDPATGAVKTRPTKRGEKFTL